MPPLPRGPIGTEADDAEPASCNGAEERGCEVMPADWPLPSADRRDTGAVERPTPALLCGSASFKTGSVARQSSAVTAEDATPTAIIIPLEEPTE